MVEPRQLCSICVGPSVDIIQCSGLSAKQSVSQNTDTSQKAQLPASVVVECLCYTFVGLLGKKVGVLVSVPEH
jgi:hypothetical protein